MSYSVIGIDGCRAGWVATFLSEATAEVKFYATIDSLLENLPPTPSWIDIPIGLSEKDRLRTIDQNARRLLPTSLKSSFFSPPSRPALLAKDYPEACVINMTIERKKLSLQSWNIAPKIAEVDRFLTKHPAWIKNLVESHPELCFYYLNHQKALLNKKKTKAGISERLDILCTYYPHLEAVYDQFVVETKRKDIQRDDILDSMVLATAALLSRHKTQRIITDIISKDKLDIPLGIYYYQPTQSSI